MNKSDSIGALAKALAAAQSKMGHALKEANNPAFKSKYADLSNVIEAIRIPLSSNDLSYVQLGEASDSAAVVETVLMHASGEWISSVVAVAVKDKGPHAFGSAMTYARRYGLSAIVGLTQADDDGNAGSHAPEVEGVPESIVANHIAAIDSADDADALKAAFAAAYKTCKHDESALRSISAAKDARKALVARVSA
jgi:hypothetical protein